YSPLAQPEDPQGGKVPLCAGLTPEFDNALPHHTFLARTPCESGTSSCHAAPLQIRDPSSPVVGLQFSRPTSAPQPRSSYTFPRTDGLLDDIRHGPETLHRSLGCVLLGSFLQRESSPGQHVRMQCFLRTRTRSHGSTNRSGPFPPLMHPLSRLGFG